MISLFLGQSGGASILLDKVVAVVDKEVITWSELYKAMSFEYESSLRGLNPEEKKRYLETVQVDFLDKLITMRLQLEEAKKAGFSVNDSEAKAAIDDIRSQYKLSEDQFREALKKEGFNYDDYFQRITNQILINKVVYNEVRSKIVISDEEVETYIKEHREELPMSLTFKLSEIQFKKPVGEKEESEVNALVDQIYKKISDGIKFSDIISEFVSNPRVKFAGETDYIQASDLREELLKNIKGLEEEAVSSPIYTEDGVFIIKIVKKESPVSHDALRDNIRKTLMEKKTEASYLQWVKKLRQKAFIEIKL
jgi:peptidyl-prolyl cis-trans isomerase SurA